MEAPDRPPADPTPPKRQTEDAAAPAETPAPQAAAPGAAGSDTTPTPLPEWCNYQPERYDELLAESVSSTRERFSEYLVEGVQLDIFRSPEKHFRLRVKFLVSGNEAEPGDSDDESDLPDTTPALRHAGWHQGAPYCVDSYPIASEIICNLMPKMIAHLSANRALRYNLRGVQYLSTLKGDLLVTLVYEKRKLGAVWLRHAEALREALGVDIIAQSKGVERLVGGRKHVTEELAFRGEAPLHYRQIAGNFSNPNGRMAEHTLSWLASCFDGKDRVFDAKGTDLLELYCGCGNHTMAMSRSFRRVLSVEINRKLVAAAHLNLTLNRAANAFVLRAPSENFCSAMLRHSVWKLTLEKYYKDSAPDAATVEGLEDFIKSQKAALSPQEQEEDVATFSFGAVIVDPPRAGLDEVTCKLVSRYPCIAYISCNPDALKRDLKILSATHWVARMAVFDHFPYTGHLECGALLVKKEEEEKVAVPTEGAGEES